MPRQGLQRISRGGIRKCGCRLFFSCNPCRFCDMLQCMYKPFLFSMLTAGLVLGAESFENLPFGDVTSGATELGQLSADAGHAEIFKKGRTGSKSLRIKGGAGKEATFVLEQKLKKDTRATFWLERWTKKDPFNVVVKAVAPAGEKDLTKVEGVGSGGFHKKVDVVLPAGTTALRITADTPEETGILIDDVALMTGIMKVNSVTPITPGVWPLMKRAKFNPMMALNVETQGAEKPKTVEKVEITLDNPEQVARITLRSGSRNGDDFKNTVEYGSAAPGKGGKVVIKSETPLEGGENCLWLDVEPSEESIIGSTVTIEKVKVTVGGQPYELDIKPVTQRIGIMLAFPGDDVAQLQGDARPCAAFRIPGLVATKKGTIIGCFDARYDNEVDLCRDIDVAAVRSTDGGQTWTLPKVNMDSGPGMANGCGDPCILQDKKGRVWMQALACHFAPGARAINASGTGTDPSKTGQWEMVYSDDEGKTWSKIMNVTEQVKKDEWTLILAGPGNGICTSKGYIVFPAQIWQNGADPVCRSCICYSKDGGKTWKMSNGVPAKSSECQVVELQDGSLMLNCRNENYGGKRFVFVTKDMGETWEPHESNAKTLNDPTCQASLIAVETEKYGRILLFSNPWIHGRSNMSIRASRDDGKTWSEGVLYDVRGCMGYSCAALTDPEHVGIIYETCHKNGETDYRGIGFIRLPLETIVTGKEVPVKAAPGADSGKKGKKGKKGKPDKKKKKKK